MREHVMIVHWPHEHYCYECHVDLCSSYLVPARDVRWCTLGQEERQHRPHCWKPTNIAEHMDEHPFSIASMGGDPFLFDILDLPRKPMLGTEE